MADADLTLSKTLQTTGTIYDGEHVTFQVQVGNTGPDAAQGVIVSDASFSDLSGVTFGTPSVGTLNGGNWNLGSLASGATDTITVSGTINNAGAFSNTASATTTTYQATDPTATAITSTASGSAVADANLTLSKTLQTTGTIYDGEHVTFQVQVGNTCPDAAQGVIVSDASFSDLSGVTFGTPSVGTLNDGNWNLGSLASGATDTITVSGTINNAGAFSNTASATTTTYQATDPTATAITATASGSAVADANLTLSKTLQTTGTIYDGEHVTFQVQVGNTGPDAAQGVIVSDASFSDLSGVTFGSAPAGTTLSGGNWDIASLASGTTDTITVSGTITNAGTFSNTASATTTTYQATDPTAAAITSTASSSAVADAALTLSKTLQTTGTIYDGEHVTFQVQVGNTGPDAAQGVIVSDASFSDLSGVTFGTPSVGTLNGGNWNLGSLASGATDTITVSGTISNAGAFANTASATTTTYQATDPTGTAITSTASGSAVADANLTLSKTLQTTGTIYDGEHVTFQVQVGNTGPDAAQGVIVSDASFSDLSGVTFGTPSVGTLNGGNWNLGSLASGATDTITVSGTISNAGAFSNTASATTTTYQATDPTATAITATASGSAVADANLTLSKTLQTTGTIYDGEHVTFQVQVGNTGLDAAQGVIVSDASFSDLSGVTFGTPSVGTLNGSNWNLALTGFRCHRYHYRQRHHQQCSGPSRILRALQPPPIKLLIQPAQPSPQLPAAAPLPMPI